MTLNDLEPLNGGFNIFRDFWLRRIFQEQIAPKSLNIDQHNLHMKFSALNVDFNSLKFRPRMLKESCTGASNLGTPFKTRDFFYID